MAEPLAPDTYGQFLADLKGRIRTAQLRASMAVNRELVLLYWQIGRDILERQAQQGRQVQQAPPAQREPPGRPAPQERQAQREARRAV